MNISQIGDVETLIIVLSASTQGFIFYLTIEFFRNTQSWQCCHFCIAL